MERAILVGMKRLSLTVAAIAVGACTDAGSREAELQDSAMQARDEPVSASQPVQADSLSPAPGQAPTPRTPPQRAPQSAPAEPSRTDPQLQPPPPRDTRPSIPYPQDTITPI